MSSLTPDFKKGHSYQSIQKKVDKKGNVKIVKKDIIMVADKDYYNEPDYIKEQYIHWENCAACRV